MGPQQMHCWHMEKTGSGLERWPASRTSPGMCRRRARSRPT